MALAGPEGALVALAIGQNFDARPIEPIGVPVARLGDAGLGEAAPCARTFQAPAGEVALGVIHTRAVAHAKTGRHAVAPLAVVAHAIAQLLGAEPVQHIVFPLAGLLVAVLGLGDSQSLTLAVGDLADIVRAVVCADPLRILERGERRAGGDDLRLARHRACRIGRFPRLVEYRARLDRRALRLVD